MTVIAWDGKILAADRMAASGAVKNSVTKIRAMTINPAAMDMPAGKYLVGGAGTASAILEHMAWLQRGADPDDFPDRLRNDDVPSILIAVHESGVILSFEDGAYPIVIEDDHYAIGSGREFALTAMFLGKAADEAVEIACALSPTCGDGVDVLEFEP